MKEKRLKTRGEVTADFANKGISIRSWAIANGIAPSVARSVLSGRLTGRIGESHKAAVLLGIKHGEIVDQEGNHA
ncbi:MAG: DNA-binding protein [Betaproteobacteria bacterium]|nr:DNA-binding protein [Betaproteobacteria bacterium]